MVFQETNDRDVDWNGSSGWRQVNKYETHMECLQRMSIRSRISTRYDGVIFCKSRDWV